MEPMDWLPASDADLIGSATSIDGIIGALTAHGCSNLTPLIDPGAFSEFPLAGGGYCDVYQGALKSGTRIAVKSLRFYPKSEETIDVDRQKVLKRAAREMYCWSKLRHGNVLPLLGFTIFRGHLSMVSEWMHHGNLVAYRSRNPGMGWLKPCMEICAGICYIHAAGVVHGDLKAANVMVSSDGVAMISDFGNTQIKDLTLDFTRTTGNGVSLRWAAPELLLRDKGPEMSKEADVYAYGMTVLEVITDKVPYEGIADRRVLTLVTRDSCPPARPGTKICDTLWAVLLQCWDKAPPKRPDAASVYYRLQELFTLSQSVPNEGPGVRRLNSESTVNGRNYWQHRTRDLSRPLDNRSAHTMSISGNSLRSLTSSACPMSIDARSSYAMSISGASLYSVPARDTIGHGFAESTRIRFSTPSNILLDVDNINHDHGVFPTSPNTHPTSATPGGFDPDSMELDNGPSSAGPSRSSTPPRSVFPTAILQGHATKSTTMANGQTSKATPLVPFRPTSMQSVQPNPNEAFKRYAGYSDFSSRMPGTVPPVPTASATDPNAPADDSVISPGMLFERGRKSSRDGTPATSRLTSPGPVAGITASGNPHGRGSPEGADGHRGWDSTMSSQPPSPTASELAEYFGQNGENGDGTTNPNGPQASTTSSRSSTSLMLSKPFKCPTPGCNKAYKQANGLKYHITHGQCPSVPVDPRLEGSTEEDYERVICPYDCGIGNCTLRFKNMNGLRYHYQHSGAHGAVGLALLASGQHHLQTGTNAGKGLGSLTDLTALSNGRSNIDINGNKIAGPPKRKGETSSVAPNPQLDAQPAMAVLGMNLRPPYKVTLYWGEPPPASDQRTVGVQNFPMDA